MTPQQKKNIIDDFNRRYYDSHSETWNNTTWLGVPIHKAPTDMVIYQEIIWRNRPELIIETGTCHGGSALFMATVLEIIGNGHVITIDLKPRPNLPKHKRIEYMTGNSADESLVSKLSEYALHRKTMVVLDSSHRKAHVDKELALFSPLVARGQYLIVEDSNINGHPVVPGWGAGPYESIAEFIPNHPEFIIDRTQERFMLTFNPTGYLLKK